jgi:hypothetical protein
VKDDGLVEDLVERLTQLVFVHVVSLASRRHDLRLHPREEAIDHRHNRAPTAAVPALLAHPHLAEWVCATVT